MPARRRLQTIPVLEVVIDSRDSDVTRHAAGLVRAAADGRGYTARGPSRFRRWRGTLEIPAQDPLYPPTAWPGVIIHSATVFIDHPDSELIDAVTRQPLPSGIRVEYRNETRPTA